MRNIELYLDGERVVTPGIDYGRTPMVVTTRVNPDTKQPRVIVAKVAGHSTWGGRGSARDYAPTQYLVFLVTDSFSDGKGGTRHHADVVVDFPAGTKHQREERQRRQARREELQREARR